MRCDECTLSNTRINYVFGCGSKNSRFLFLSEAPSVSEDMLGKAYVSDSNKLLKEIIIKAGYDLMDCFFSYIVFCRPCEKKNHPSRSPTEDEILTCMPNVLAETALVNFQGVILIDKLVEKYYKTRLHVPTIKIVSPQLIKLKGGRASNLYIDTIQKLEKFYDKITND